MVLCGRRGEAQGEAQGELRLKSWYVCLSKASRRLASPAQTAADPCGDSPASCCCRVPLKNTSALLEWLAIWATVPSRSPLLCQAWVWEAWERSMAASPNSYIPVILFLVSPQCVLTQLHAVMPSILSCCFPLYSHAQTHIRCTHTWETHSAHLLVSWSAICPSMLYFS